jgi:hypothetical protein
MLVAATTVVTITAIAIVVLRRFGLAGALVAMVGCAASTVAGPAPRLTSSPAACQRMLLSISFPLVTESNLIGRGIGVLGKAFGQYFDRDIAIQFLIARAIDFTHPARANLRADFMTTEMYAYCESHCLVGAS